MAERESRYSQSNIELCGLVTILKKFQLWFWGVQFTLEYNCSSIEQMINSSGLPNSAMNRWLLTIKFFDFDLQHVTETRFKMPNDFSRVARAPKDSDAVSASALSNPALVLTREASVMPSFLAEARPTDSRNHIEQARDTQVDPQLNTVHFTSFPIFL